LTLLLCSSYVELETFHICCSCEEYETLKMTPPPPSPAATTTPLPPPGATKASTGSPISSAAAHAAAPAAAREGANPVTRAIGTASLTTLGPLAATATTSMATAPLAAPPAAAPAAAAATTAATNGPDNITFQASSIVNCKLSLSLKNYKNVF
jgi:hypothetical protein